MEQVFSDADSEQRDAYRAAMNELAQRYLVRDVLPEDVRFVFLLESPHVQELKFGAPVSGSSGASMTKHLFGNKYGPLPIGRLLLAHQMGEIPDAALQRVGLMNTCNIPLQAAGYDPADQRRYSDLLNILEGIRSANDRDRYTGIYWNEVQEIMVNGLRRRLQKLIDLQLVMVPCGRFAQKFFRLADVTSTRWSVLSGIPHPSYNGFSQPRYREAVEDMKARFQHEVLGL